MNRAAKYGIAIAAAGGVAYAASRAATRKQELIAHSSFIVNCSPQEAYQFWRNFENFPLFMRHLESVTVLGDRRSRWIAIGPMGSHIRWDAEILSERENEWISWHSLPGSDLDLDGRVEFRTAPGKRGTLIDAIISYRPLGGAAGRAVAKLFGKDPNFLMRQDMRRFKALIETGEIPTTEGQTHGPRSAAAGLARIIDPDSPVRRESKIMDVIKARRRAS